jgi:Fe-S cluster assembly protein SufD
MTSESSRPPSETEDIFWSFITSEQKAFQSSQAREKALHALKACGVPTRRCEEWKYTDLRAQMPEPFPSQKNREDIRPPSPCVLSQPHFTLDILNGRLITQDLADLHSAGIYVEERSEITLSSLGESLLSSPTTSFPYSLNTALAPCTVHIAIQESLSQPLVVRIRTCVSSPMATYPRIEWSVDSGVVCSIVEIHDGPPHMDYHTISSCHWMLEDNASVAHACLHKDGSQALVLSTQSLSIGSFSNFESVQVNLGGAFCRTTTWATFQGKKAHISLRGSSLLHKNQHNDTTLYVHHTYPECTSTELFKTILDDNATGVFQGKVSVHQKAQKTDGKMLSAALLLSDHATMNNKPELEIFADDVRCGHGATCGALDEGALFYARSRGLSQHDAETLLLGAFVSDILDSVAHEAVYDLLSESVVSWLAQREKNLLSKA